VLLTPLTSRLIGEWVAGKTLSEDCERFSPLRFRAAKHTSSVSSAHH